MPRIATMLLLFCTALSVKVTAQTTTNRPIPVAVPFLNFNYDMRAAGMGEAAASLPGNNANHFANPARMMSVDAKAGAQVSYSPWLQNISNRIAQYSVSGFLHTDENQTFSGGFRYFKQGSMKMTDESGNTLSESKPSDLAIDLSYARRLSETWNIGASMRYINSRVLTSSSTYANYQNGNTLAMDLGVYYEGKQNDKGGSWHFGSAITNLGGKLKYEENDANQYYLPTNFSAGGAYKKVQDEHQFVFTAQLDKLLVPSIQEDGTQPDKSTIESMFSSWGDAPGGFSEEMKEMMLAAGAEYTYNNLLSVRAGYKYESREKGGANYFTSGLGLQLKPVELNMAYIIPTGGTANNVMPNTWKLGMAFSFNK